MKKVNYMLYSQLMAARFTSFDDALNDATVSAKD